MTGTQTSGVMPTDEECQEAVVLVSTEQFDSLGAYDSYGAAGIRMTTPARPLLSTSTAMEPSSLALRSTNVICMDRLKLVSP